MRSRPRGRFAATASAFALLLAIGACAHAPDPSRPPASPIAGATDSLEVASALLAEFEASLDKASPSDLVELAQRALSIREARLGPDHPSVAAARGAVGRAMIELGDYAGAVSRMRAAIAVLDRPDARDSTGLGTNLNALGRAYTLMGNFDEARPALERSLAIRDAHHGPASPQVRITLNNLANVLATQGDLETARPFYERLVAIEDAAQPPDSARLAINLHNLANVVSDLGEHARGQALYERALEIRERVYGPRHLRLANTLNNMASLAEVMGNDSLAEATMSRAIDIRGGALGERHPLTAEWITTRAAILSRLGQSERAAREALRGERLSREHLLLTARSLSEDDAMAYEGFRISGLDVALHEASRHGANDAPMMAAVFDALVRSRSLLLDEMAARRRVRATSGDTALAGLEAAWSQARQAYADLALRGLRAAAADSAYRARAEAARQAAEAAETRLAERSASFRREERRASLGGPEVLAALPKDAVLVGYARYRTPDVDPSGAGPPHYLAIVASSDGRLVPVGLGPARGIDSLVARWRAAASAPRGSEAAYRGDARRLRAAIWDPLATALRGAKRVFVVPDGAIQLVNLATLPAGTGYLVEHGPLLHVLTTERDLVLPDEPPASGGDLLAFGGVDFERASPPGEAPTDAAPSPGASAAYRGAAPDCESFRTHPFLPLRGTEGETREVVALWARSAHAGGRGILRLGPEAAEAEFKRLAPQCRAIHVATHGFFLEPECLSVSEREGVSASNSLLLSGLALAGANRHAVEDDGEDGLLTAEEIAALDLSRAEWVVLSACDTGVGSIVQGEGVFGLRRAFEIAGAGTLIMSLWTVGDAATRHWMHDLYEARVIEKRPAAEAVRQASRMALKDLRARGASTHPASWGAFIACGDWR